MFALLRTLFKRGTLTGAISATYKKPAQHYQQLQEYRGGSRQYYETIAKLNIMFCMYQLVKFIINLLFHYNCLFFKFSL